MKIPFFAEMEKANRVLIAGAGGGFDIFCGLPLYFWLKHAGKEVHLANLSFSELPWCDGERPVPSLVRVTARTGGSSNYFPEVHLASWWARSSAKLQFTRSNVPAFVRWLRLINGWRKPSESTR
jgi:hypothetical protein